MNRHLVRLTLAVTSAVWTSAVQAAEPPRRPNVVLFLVDDMGWMDSSTYGSEYYETPNVERLAKVSMRFTDAYACPLCSPTRASILSGKYSARHGITSPTGHLPPQPADHRFLPEKAAPHRKLITPESKNYLDPAEYTLAEALRDAGYRTGHFGKWHVGLTPPHGPQKQGFGVAFYCGPDASPPSYFSPYGVRQDGDPSYKNRIGTITDGPEGEYITDRLTDEALKFIEANRERPFFLNLWHYGVHGPWGHKEAYTREFAKKKDPRDKQGNPIMASMLKSVDESLGRVLDTLDRLKLAEHTIVVFCSDNGGDTHSNTPEDVRTRPVPMVEAWSKWAGDRSPTNNAPLRDGKGTLYEGGTRVPLLVRCPGVVRPGTISAEIVGAIDLYPTLLDLLGLPQPEHQSMDGISFAGVLRQTGTLNRAAFFNYSPHGGLAKVPGVSVRAGDWKLLRWFETNARFPSRHELYNLRADLGETKNLAAAMPDKVKELDALIDGFLKDTGALAPKPNPAYRPGASDK